MASTFKRLNSEDIAVTRTPLYESIPITASLVSSSVYLSSNIKSYSHGMFQSVYDYPYLSSSANQLFDITLGRTSATSGSINQRTQKVNIYNQMAQVLVGYDQTGSIKKFNDKNSSSVGESNTDFQNAYFLSFSRLLVKDEIKRGSFQLSIGVGASFDQPFASLMTIDDSNALTNYYTDSPTGEYGILKNTSGGTSTANKNVGLIYYQAGVVVLSPHIFAVSGTSAELSNLAINQKGQLASAALMYGLSGSGVYASGSIQEVINTGSIDGIADSLRKRIRNIQFSNTTELNSTIYFCRANSQEFNYSSNPTYLSSSKIIVKEVSTDAPVSYVTTVGLYSVSNELLAVAKLSEPLKKTPEDSLVLRVRLDV